MMWSSAGSAWQDLAGMVTRGHLARLRLPGLAWPAALVTVWGASCALHSYRVAAWLGTR